MASSFVRAATVLPHRARRVALLSTLRAAAPRTLSVGTAASAAPALPLANRLNMGPPHALVVDGPAAVAGASTGAARGMAFARKSHEWDADGQLRPVRRTTAKQLRKVQQRQSEERKARLYAWWRAQGFSKHGRVNTMVRRGHGRFREPEQCRPHLEALQALLSPEPFYIRPRQAVNMVQACTNLFFMPLEHVEANLAALKAHEGLAQTDLHHLVYKNARMIATDPVEFAEILDSLH